MARAGEPRLTDAECDVLRGILAGHSNAVIANLRKTSVRTVANQVGSILRKLGADSRFDLLRRAAMSRSGQLASAQQPAANKSVADDVVLDNTVAGEVVLTPAERDVARLAALGHSYKYIALELGHPLSTVASRLRRAMRKLRARSRAELMACLGQPRGA